MLYFGHLKKVFIMGSVAGKIEKKIMSRSRGTFVFSTDFAALGSPEAVTKSLQRLKSSGKILRVAHGIYYFPKIDTKFGLGEIPPSIEEIAYAIARRDRVRIFPTGSYALHALGLSTQVPANVVFITDGSPRRINMGRGKGILFKHSDETRNFAYWSKEIQLAVSAMREIGEDNITHEQIQIIRQTIQAVSIDKFNHDVALAPAWIRKILIS